MGQVSIHWAEFIGKYKPVQNPANHKAALGGFLFLAVGAELAYVRSVGAQRVWTVLDTSNDGKGAYSLVSGFQGPFSVGHIVSEVALPYGEHVLVDCPVLPNGAEELPPMLAQWRPISEAPCDGTELLLTSWSLQYGFGETDFGCFEHIEDSDFDGSPVWGWSSNYGRVEEPTHFMQTGIPPVVPEDDGSWIDLVVCTDDSIKELEFP